MVCCLRAYNRQLAPRTSPDHDFFLRYFELCLLCLFLRSTPNSRSASASSSASSSRSASLDRASMRDRSDDDRDFDRRRARGRDRDPSSRATERALSPVPVEPSATTLARQQLIANEVEAVTRTFSGQQDQVLGDHAHVQQDIHLLRLDLVEVKEVAGRQADGQIRTQNVALAARLKDCQREIKSQTAGLAECQKKLQGVQGSQREHDLPRLCEFQLETADTIKTLEKDITDLQAAQAARASDASKASKRFESQQNFAKEIQDIQSGINRRADAGFQEIEGCVRSLQMEFYEIKLEKEGFDTVRATACACCVYSCAHGPLLMLIILILTLMVPFPGFFLLLFMIFILSRR
eukprot:m.269265 g.269265  ORF g.269265 m.269265 type:complete len:350 (-) comp54735_c0_seq34:45-1094(-)